MEQKTITVEDMACSGCETTVEDALRGLEGVKFVEANNETDTVEIRGDVDDDDVRAAIEDAGYSVAA